MPSKTLEMVLEPEKTQEWNAQRLVFQRKNSQLSHSQLAQAMGVSQKQIVCIENCSRIPSAELLETLVSFFDVPEDYFGVEAIGGSINAKPIKLSPQDERQQAAKIKLKKQRHTLRRIMKIAGFPINCTGLHYLAEAINEPLSDTCRFVNGEIEMPPDTMNKLHTWFSSIPKPTK